LLGLRHVLELFLLLFLLWLRRRKIFSIQSILWVESTDIFCPTAGPCGYRLFPSILIEIVIASIRCKVHV
jgi:hypothetical protein